MQSEFRFIQNIKERHRLRRVGDDCAVMPKDAETDMVVTVDMLVEEIDFRLDWTSDEFLGHKALAVSLSDVAAMGARPVWAMLSIGVPERLWKSDFMDRFYYGWHTLGSLVGVELVGGDISRSPDMLVIDSIVSGEVAKGNAILRSGAKAGDSIFVTGSLGGAAAGLRLLQSGTNYDGDLTDWKKLLLLCQLAPNARTNLVEKIHDLQPTAMIDISDGLSSDLRHICSSSGVGAVIYSDQIPIDRGIQHLELPKSEELELALHGGEDFELLFTVDMKKNSASDFDGFSHIGEVTANAGIIELIGDEKTEILEAKGFQHFR